MTTLSRSRISYEETSIFPASWWKCSDELEIVHEVKRGLPGLEILKDVYKVR